MKKTKTAKQPVEFSYSRDRLVFDKSLLTPANVQDIPKQGYGAPFVILKDGEFDVEIDNEYILMPKIIFLSVAGEQIVKSDGAWGKKENISPKDLEGLHEFNSISSDADVEWKQIIETYYSGDHAKDEDRVSAVNQMLIYPNIQMECDKILKLMEINQDTLCKPANRPFLAYLMLRWQNLYSAGRICFGDRGCLDIAKLGQCENNPKYEFEDMGTDENEDIIYDAWGAGISMESILPPDWTKQFSGLGERQIQFNEKDFDELSTYFDASDDFTTLLYKKNKTMEDWYALLGNAKYRYNSMYKTQHSIDDHLLCVIGNGYGWNRDGYITNDGPSGEDESDYGRFPMLKGHSTGECAEIETKLNAILQQPHVQKTLDLSRDWFLESVVDRIRKDVLDRGRGVRSSVIDVVYGRANKDVKVGALKIEAIARGFDNESFMLKLIDPTDGSQKDYDAKKAGKCIEYQYDERHDVLYRNEEDGKQGWAIYAKGKWCDIVDAEGNVIAPDADKMADAKETIDAINRVAARDEDEHPIYAETVNKIWATISDEAKLKVAEAKTQLDIFHKEREAARVAAGGKAWKDMTLKEKISGMGEKTKTTKVEQSYEKIMSDMVDKINHLANKELGKLTNSQILEIKKVQDAALDRFIARESSDDGLLPMSKPKRDYYPLSRSSAIIKPPKNAHQSYINAGVRIMEAIVEGNDEFMSKLDKYNKKDSNKIAAQKTNLKYAQEWLAKHGPEKYKQFAPKVVDYEAIFQKYLAKLEPTKDLFEYVDGRLNIHGAPSAKKANFYRVDKNESDYSEHMIIGYWNIEGMDFPKVFGDQIELIEGTPLYAPIREIMSQAIQVNRVAQFKITVDNVMKHEVKLTIKFEYDEWSTPESSNFAWQIDNKFLKKSGFLLGENSMVLELDEVILVTSRAKTLGLNHPNNESGEEFFSNAQYFDVYDKGWKKIGGFNIDERGFNTFSGSCNNKKVTEWLHAQHKAMKLAHPEYGNYDSNNRDNTKEGQKNLYAHDFMLWLKKHQLETVK